MSHNLKNKKKISIMSFYLGTCMPAVNLLPIKVSPESWKPSILGFISETLTALQTAALKLFEIVKLYDCVPSSESPKKQFKNEIVLYSKIVSVCLKVENNPL